MTKGLHPWPYRPYTEIIAERANRFIKIQADPNLQLGAKEYYKDKPVEFINDWLVTYDPRNSTNPDRPTTMPFVLFPKQEQLVLFLYECLKDGESGLIEKARDMGATWVNCAFSVWGYLFLDGISIGWGSRKEQLVDKIGDPDSIFEKIRIMLNMTPTWFLPTGFDPLRHCSYMKIRNPENGATITGEAGDNIGRGGRKSLYFKDESAHYERPELIEAALGDNTDVQIDFSSVNGPGNVFHRRRLNGVVWEPGLEIPSGMTRVFVMDWRDHPLKTEEWYNKRKEKAEREGLTNVFYQEVDRDYNSAVEGVVIPGKWVQAAVDLHKRLEEEPSGKVISGLDVYDEGGDAHSFVARKGYLLLRADQWFQGDTGDATRHVMPLCRELGVDSFQFDSVGVGAGVKTELNRLKNSNDPLFYEDMHIQPWMGNAKVLHPAQKLFPEEEKSLKNRDFYKNLKAQGWWQLRLRFERTYKFVNKGEYFDYDDLIAIPKDLEFFDQLINELSQPTYSKDAGGKIIIDKKPSGTRSPNLGDSTVMAYWPADPIIVGEIVGAPSGISNPQNIVIG